MSVGGTINLVANLGGEATGQTVAWTSSSTAIATVDAASGVVTGVSNGTVAVTATTTGGFAGSATVNVGDATGGGTASVTIASITKDDLNTPVDLNNAFGQIDVTLNIDAAGQSLSKVELVVTDSLTGAESVCATQTITSASLAAMAEGVSASVVGAEASVAAQAAVVLSCNTAAVAGNGAVTFTNGPKSISARIYNGAGTLINTAANTVRVRFANESGFVASITNTPTSPAALRNAEGTAVSTNDNLLYHQGGLTITLTGANFEPGQTANFATVAGELNRTAGAGVVNVLLTFTNVAGTQNFTATVPVATIAAASGTYELDVLGSTTAGGSVGPTVVTGVTAVRVDNVAPTDVDTFAVPAVDFYVNNSYSFAASNGTLFTGPGALSDTSGVGGTTVKFFAGDLADVEDVLAFGDSPSDSADFSGLTEITTAAALDTTLASDAYGLIAVTYDKLGNYVAQRAPADFGVDRAAPTGFAYTSTTPADSSTSQAADTVAFDNADFADNASGFSATPLRVSISQTTGTATTCPVGTGAACAAIAQADTFSFTPATEAYFTVTSSLTDKAGNATDAETHLFLYDATGPTFSGGVTMPGTIAGGSSVIFAKTIADNLDLDMGTLSLVYLNLPAPLRFDMKDLGSFGVPLERTASPAFTISSFIRSMQQVASGGAPIAPTGNDKPTTVRFWAMDVAGNWAADDSTALPGANITGSAPNFMSLGIAEFVVATPATVVNNDAAADENLTVDLVATVKGAPNDLTLTDPFGDGVVFWYLDTDSGELVRVGSATAAVMTDEANVRTFTYRFNDWDPPVELGTTGTVTIVATGIRGNDGLATQVDTSITLQVQP